MALNLNAHPVDQKVPSGNPQKMAEPGLIDSLRSNERSEAGRDSEEKLPDDDVLRLHRLQEQQVKLKLRNVLLNKLKSELISIQEMIMRLHCLADANVLSDLRAQQRISGDDTSPVGHIHDVCEELDRASNTISDLGHLVSLIAALPEDKADRLYKNYFPE